MGLQLRSRGWLILQVHRHWHIQQPTPLRQELAGCLDQRLLLRMFVLASDNNLFTLRSPGSQYHHTLRAPWRHPSGGLRAQLLVARIWRPGQMASATISLRVRHTCCGKHEQFISRVVLAACLGRGIIATNTLAWPTNKWA